MGLSLRMYVCVCVWFYVCGFLCVHVCLFNACAFLFVLYVFVLWLCGFYTCACCLFVYMVMDIDFNGIFFILSILILLRKLVLHFFICVLLYG